MVKNAVLLLLLLAGAVAAFEPGVHDGPVMSVDVGTTLLKVSVPLAGNPDECGPCADWSAWIVSQERMRKAADNSSYGGSDDSCTVSWADGSQSCDFTVQPGKVYKVDVSLTCGCSAPPGPALWYETRYFTADSLPSSGGGVVSAEWRAWRNSLGPFKGQKPEYQVDTDTVWYVHKCRVGEWLRGMFEN